MRAAFVGYNVWLYKWLAFTLSAAVAGLAGALFAMAQQSAYPNVMSLHYVGLRRDDGADRRRPGELLGAGARRAVLHPRARPARRVHRDLAALVRPAVHGDGAVPARRHRRRLAGMARARVGRVPRRAARRGARRPEHGAVRSRGTCTSASATQVVLEDISLSFEEGRLSGIMGPNGAGKTTCFNVLTGRYAPDRGEVRFAGEDITGPRRARSRGAGISRSFQIMNLFNDYTALDNVLVALPGGAPRAASTLARPGRATPARRTRRPRCWPASAWPGKERVPAQEPVLRRTARARDRRGARRASRACCSSTSRPPASARRARRGSPS